MTQDEQAKVLKLCREIVNVNRLDAGGQEKDIAELQKVMTESYLNTRLDNLADKLKDPKYAYEMNNLFKLVEAHISVRTGLDNWI